MPLTDVALRAAKAREKAYRLTDGKGLYCEVSPAGNRLWRLKYRFQGKEKRLSLGQWPEVGLKEARLKRDEARKVLAAGSDPGEERKQAKRAAAATFEVVAREWIEIRRSGWAASHAERTEGRLRRFVFPWLGAQAIEGVTAEVLLGVLRRVEERSAGEAHRVRVILGQVLDFAVQTGRAAGNPARSLRGALKPAPSGHFAAPTTPEALRGVLLALDSYRGSAPVEAALKVAPLLVARPGELRRMRWADVDLEAKEWRFTVPKTKTEHCVPLCRQAIEVLQSLQPITGSEPFVFPNGRTKGAPMSENAVLAALRRAGLSKEEASGHGFRASFRTICDEVLGERVDLIEHQLAHKVRDPLGRAYNRTSFLPERHRVLQRWGDYCDGLREEAKIIPIRKGVIKAS